MSRALDPVDALGVARPPALPTNGHVLPPPRHADGREPDGGGSPSPRGVAPIVLATVFVIAGEIMLFAGLVFGFWVLRLAAPVWPPPLQPRLPIAVTGVNSLVLLASAVTVIAAVRAGGRSDRARLVRWLGLTAALGAVFLAVQGFEWLRLVRFGLTVSSGLYGATFYTLVGAHALHVVVALGWLTVMLAWAVRGELRPERRPLFHSCAAYWSFVVGLWPILYLSVYVA